MGAIRAVDVAAVAAGAASGLAVENLARAVFPNARTELGAAGLLTAALIYPAARGGSRAGLASAREVAGVAAATTLVTEARRRGGMTARALIAAGWLSHALFDVVHDAGPGGRLPRWYPALCAGYDLAFAAALLRPARVSGSAGWATPGPEAEFPAAATGHAGPLRLPAPASGRRSSRWRYLPE